MKINNLKIALMVMTMSILPACGSSSGGGGGGGGTTPVDVNTLDGQTGIATDSTFRYTFSGPVDASTVTSTSYFMVPTPTSTSVSVATAKAAYDPTICDSDNAIGATITPGALYADLAPSNPFSANTGYTICLSTDIMVNGSAFSGFMASFDSQGGGTQTERLRITNSCSYTIWIQQQNMPSGTPEVVKLVSGAHQDYQIPDAGLASTRLWPKTGCDDDGNNCTIGQSSDPCPAAGCVPPVDSKIEATWGCTLSDQSQCGYDPQGDQLIDTYWNASAVDGYTLPFTITVSGNSITDQSAPCENVNCADLSLTSCPTSEDLSVGQGGSSYPAYANEDLQVKDASNNVIGCYSPCKKFNYPTYGGLNLSETSDPPVIYCCPTPPISSEECRAGPVVNTDYVTGVHTMCSNTVYGYAYDDKLGLRHCSAATLVSMTFGPYCP